MLKDFVGTPAACDAGLGIIEAHTDVRQLSTVRDMIALLSSQTAEVLRDSGDLAKAKIRCERAVRGESNRKAMEMLIHTLGVRATILFDLGETESCQADLLEAESLKQKL